MHPLFLRRRQLGLYLLAWIPLAGILIYLLAEGGGLTLLEATAITIPLCLVYAFVCLAAWYPCRATPLEKSSFPKLLLTHLIAAALLGTYWTYQAKEIAVLLAHFWIRFNGSGPASCKALSAALDHRSFALSDVGNISLRIAGGASFA